MSLPYGFEALAPALSKKTLELHYMRHHQGYVNKFNELVVSNVSYSGMTLEEVAKASCRDHDKRIFNNAAQIIAHDMYWRSLTPDAEKHTLKNGTLRTTIVETFGSFDVFLGELVQSGLGQFGSGWVWVLCNAEKVEITTSSNAYLPWLESPEKTPLLTIDVWEHAYYVDYYNQQEQYLKQIVHYLNWDEAERKYASVLGSH